MSNANARHIRGDCWRGARNEEWQLDEASADDVEQALERLDARTYTLLTIRGFGERHMTIGGGAGRYVVYATFNDEEYWDLLAPEPRDGAVSLNAGGRRGDFSAKQVVDLRQARAAGRLFYHQCRLDPDQKWGRQH